MLKNVIANIDKHFEKDPEPSTWNPAGSKAILRNNAKLDGYRKLAKKKYLQLVKDKEFNKRVESIHHNEELMNKKLGLFRKANIFYLKEMYNDCFKTVVQAIEIVKKELESTQTKESTKEREWKLKLALPLDTKVDFESLAAEHSDEDNKHSSRSATSAKNEKAKLWVIAEKMGMLGGNSLSANGFLNYQIQQLYKKAEKKIESNAQTLMLMRSKIDKLEDYNEEDDNPDDIERQIVGLNQAVQVHTKRIEEGKPPVAWKPTSAQDAVLGNHSSYSPPSIILHNRYE